MCHFQTFLFYHLYATSYKLLYKLIKSDKDAQSLQKDLNSLVKWEEDWQMSFHPEKCQVIHICSNPRYRQRRQYTLHGHILESVDSAKYLGVHLSQDMTWQTHVNRTAAKASSTLGFLRRNLHSCRKNLQHVHTANAELCLCCVGPLPIQGC